MKKLAKVFVVAMLLGIAVFARTAAAAEIGVELDSLLSTLMYGYDDDQFTGRFSFTVRGEATDNAAVILENEAGEVVFDRKFKCEDYYGDDSCYFEPNEQKGFDPYAPVAGPHTLKILFNDEVVFTLPFILTIDNSYGYNSIYIEGEWDALATLGVDSEPMVTVKLFLGGAEMCDVEGGLDTQVKLKRGDDTIAHGFVDGYFYPGCSMSSLNIPLFYIDESGFVAPIIGEDIKKNAGKYGIELYIDGELVRTYDFIVSGGTVKSIPNKTLGGSLGGDNMIAYGESKWIFSN